MGVAVYPRLDELLRARNLTVAELERQIKQRFGLSVAPKTLYRLTHTEPVQRADLEIAGAAAAVLGVGLDDIFEVQAVPVDASPDAGAAPLAPEESRRLAELLDRQAHGTILEDERNELDNLVAEYGFRLHEQRVRELAHGRGLSIEQARREIAAQLDEALAWWQAFQSDPERRRTATKRARERRARSVA